MLKKSLLSIAFVVLFCFALLLTSVEIFVAGMMLAVCYIVKWYSAVIALSDYINNAVESFAEMIAAVRDEADEVLSKNHNNLKSDI